MDETGFLFSQLPAQGRQAVLGMSDLGIDGKCSNESVTGVCGRVLGGTGSLEEVTFWWVWEDD